MHTFVLVKDIADIPQDVAHLYEHWFIASFYRYAEETLQISGGTIGYIGGNTYKNILFIEAWFYDKRVAKLFKDFSANETLYDDLLATCVSQCAAEDREVWQVRNKPRLTELFAKLRAAPWKPGDDMSPFVYDDDKQQLSSPISRHKSAASYRTVTILANMEEGSVEEKAVFMRFHVILSDIIGHYIQQKGWYKLDSLSARENSKGMYSIVSASLPRGSATNARIEDEVQNILRSFDLRANLPLIRAHFDEFADQPLWQGRIVDDLHHLNIISSNNHIASLATIERLHSLLSKLEILTETVSYAFAKDLKY